MSNLIERAAKRLEQLKAAGLDTSASVPAPMAAAGAQQAATIVPAPSAGQSELVELDVAALEAAGFVVSRTRRTRRDDEFRIIKRPLILNAVGKGGTQKVNRGNIIMVGSALPGEGKTFTSVNLALSIAAEMDHRVLLVDADVAKPSIPRILGLDPNRKGLLDVVAGQCELSEVMLRTNVDKLSVLLSGAPRPHATEMLGSAAMSSLLDEMAGRYPDRIIIFDSPPMLVTTEARELASHVGQLVMVVRAGKTLQSQVVEALAAIRGSAVRLMLLNQVEGKTGQYYEYGYGYGGYGAGSSGSGASAASAASALSAASTAAQTSPAGSS